MYCELPCGVDDCFPQNFISYSSLTIGIPTIQTSFLDLVYCYHAAHDFSEEWATLIGTG